MGNFTALIEGLGSLCTTLQDNPMGALALVVLAGIIGTTIIMWHANRRR